MTENAPNYPISQQSKGAQGARKKARQSRVDRKCDNAWRTIKAPVKNMAANL